MSITNLTPDIKSHISTYLNIVDMKLIKHMVIFAEPLQIYAAGCGYLNILNWIFSIDTKLNNELCAYAAKYGQLETLQWIIDHGGVLDSSAFQMAIKYNYIDIVKLLHKNKCHWDTFICLIAATDGHLEILQYLLANGCPHDGVKHHAIHFNQPEIVAWLTKNGY